MQAPHGLKADCFLKLMNRKNKYCYHSHLSEWKFREIMRYFAMDIEASKIAVLTGVSRNTVNKILTALRIRLVQWCDREFPLPMKGDDGSSHYSIQESYLIESEDQGKLGRRNGTKFRVLGILKNDDKIFTQFVPKISRKTLQEIMLGKISAESVFEGNGPCPYSSFVDLSSKKLYRMNNVNEVYPNKRPKLNGIDNFWGMAKVRISRFRGLSRNTIYLHMKETEFRFNNRNADLYELLLQMLRKEPLKLDGFRDETKNWRL